MNITMAHGGGGKTSAELFDNVFGKYFKNDVLKKMEDAAILELDGKVAFSTDSFVVMPLIFKGGDIGKLSVCGTVNDLLMMGAEPKYLTCGFIIEEGLPLALLEKIVISMAETAKAAGVEIVAGDTKVVERKGSDAESGLFINTSGIGAVPGGRNVSAANLDDGDAVLLSGNLGDHHACILSERMGIENNIESDCACLGSVTKKLFDNSINVKAMRDVTRGGLGTVLNELAAASGYGIEIDEKRIPVAEEVRGLCDILGLDPLYMGNEGKMVAVVPNDEAEKAITMMRTEDNSKNAVIIGRVKKTKGVVMRTKIGGTRAIDMLYGEGLPRIC